MLRELSIPQFFDPDNAGKWDYSPDQVALMAAASEARRKYGVPLAPTDKTRVHLLIIDAQRDFCLPWDNRRKRGGTLYVGGRSGRGAIDDNVRLSQFIYKNTHRITGITTTLDTHYAYQIFFAPFWQTSDGKPLSPHTMIVVGEGGQLNNVYPDGTPIHRGVRPAPEAAHAVEGVNGNYSWLFAQAKYYCEELERGNKYKLYLWPPHCQLGSDGHALAGVIHEARYYHSLLRGTQSNCETKGGNPLFECYSVFGGEVLTRADKEGVLGQRNTDIIAKLLANDAVVVAGQAASHCVKSSIEDLLTDIKQQDPTLAKKVFVMGDCMSAVVVPDEKGNIVADFTQNAQDALDMFANAGMHLVKSTDPMEFWPDIKLVA